ncbi:MAG: EAL domain-containing protein [Lachnospiraceae bacterium]|nr:EAL domain-containing protein [Lachnospiraceae bacterium]
MDFQKIVDSISAMTCVVSVETLPDGRYGKFRIAAGNKAYIDSIEHPAPGVKMLREKFVPNSEYTDYLTRDLNFEDYCCRSAVGKKCLHSYAHPDRMNVWFNMMFIPLEEPDAKQNGLSYCLYMMEISQEADYKNLSDISAETASSVLDTCLRLGHSADAVIDEKFRERSIFREMNYDHLTGLPSMTYFFKLADNGRKNMHEAGTDSAVVFINLRGMKYYNKRYGFAEGDVLIRELAVILGKVFGEENCSRFGQDHFAVITETDGLESKLKKVFRDAKKINGGKTLPVRAGIYLDSMGLVETSLACDRAKIAAGAKKDDYDSYFVYFDSRMLAREVNRQYIVDNIDRAIRENWIKAFYQPIVRSTNRKVCDEEALARWIDPEKGMLSPADFIPILEDTRLIYKVDLHIVDIILERMKTQKLKGYGIVPVSVNLSRTDFETCDIVAEINNRVETAGISKDLITIEITESVIGENFDFMKEQIERFHALGFKVWMDDFGSGYSSLDLLQEMQFDLIKFDMRFMRQFDNNPRSRIVLTDLMRMAQNLGMETVCEGVETADQADFLTDIGCTRLQGFYFSKPRPFEELLELFFSGAGNLKYEEADEAVYYKTLGDVNMYDLSSVASGDTETSKYYFDTLPMAVVEYGGGIMKVIRCNSSYREFVNRFFVMNEESFTDPYAPAENYLGFDIINAIKRCREEGNRTFINDTLDDGATLRAMVKKITDSYVDGVSAYAVAVLDVTPEKEQLTYANVAQALSSDYEYLYYVDTETDQFVEYSHDSNGKGLSAERHGEDFFNEARKDTEVFIYEADRASFLEIFTRENVMKNLDEQGVFVHTYRLMKDGVPTFVNMKIVRMRNEDRHIIIGVNNVDTQMRAQETIERLKEEQITYSRIAALMGNYIAIYTVDPNTGNYMQYSASDDYSELGTSRAGIDFFSDSRADVKKVIHPDDLDYFMSVFSKEKILERTEKGGVYKINYRLMLNNDAVRVSLRAGMVDEQDGRQLIVGINRSSDLDR